MSRITSRSKVEPSGASKVAFTTRMRWRAISSRSRDVPELRSRDDSRAVQREEVGRPGLGPLEGRADELAEQRGRPVGPALELGMGLRADPERVAVELDELHQPVVGRRARQPEARCLEPGPVARVELVAVAVALGHDVAPVGLGHPRARHRARRRRRRGASCRPRSVTSRWLSMRSMTGCGVRASISVELAPVRPRTLRAYSMVITCRPRHRPRHGMSCSRA